MCIGSHQPERGTVRSMLRGLHLIPRSAARAGAPLIPRTLISRVFAIALSLLGGLAGCDEVNSTCETCFISRSTIASVGGDIVQDVALGVTTTARGHMILLQGRSAVELDEHGNIVRQVLECAGSVGRCSSIVSIGRDSVALIDNTAGVIRIVSNSETPPDSVLLPPNATVRSMLAHRWPDQLLFSGHAAGHDGVFLAGVREGLLIIDSQLQIPNAMSTVRAPSYVISAAAPHGTWAVEIHSYDALLIGADGSVAGRIERDPDWFGKPSHGRAKGGLRSTVVSAWADDRGHLWVYSIRPTPGAGAVWRSREARRPGGTVSEGLTDLYETVVEVLNVSDGAVLADGLIPAYIVGTTADGRAVFQQQDTAGRTTISIQRLQLHLTPSTAHEPPAVIPR